jgi:hypothetical protein
MKYRKLLALAVVVFSVAISVPGCGKKDDKKPIGGPGGTAIGNGFVSIGGFGQGSVLSLNSCYSVVKAADGTIRFPIATDPNNQHYVYGGALYATAYVSNAVYAAGNSYLVQTNFGDTMTVYLAPNDQFFSGIVTLSATTVRDIQLYLQQVGVNRNSSNTSLCIDGVVFNGSTIQGSRLQGGMTLYVNDVAVITF